MKQGGWKNRGGGLKRKSEARSPEGFSRGRAGILRVRDPEYMQALHEQKVAPLDLSVPGRGVGVMELHHGLHPQGVGISRRESDAGVVPLCTGQHQFVEANPDEERALQRIFSCWSSFRYWCHKRGLGGSPEDALAYQLWVLEKLEEENA